MNRNNKIITESEARINRWEEYIKVLFENNERIEIIEPKGTNELSITKRNSKKHCAS